MSRFILRYGLAAACILVGAVIGCDWNGQRRVGEFCNDEADCESGLCYDNVCLNPDDDYDGDGIKNGVEKNITLTDYGVADTDGDGADDGAEVGSDQMTPLDFDGDLIIDALESFDISADPDKDCIPDQYDPENNVFNDDLVLVIKTNCLSDGVCGTNTEAVLALCTEGVPECVYRAVPDYEPMEVTCDQKDNDCDGETDEGLSEDDCRPPCVPACGVAVCGLDPVCGTKDCGTCETGFHCESGACCENPCVPACGAAVCGPDPVCETSCGDCGLGEECKLGTCVEMGEMVLIPEGAFSMGCNTVVDNQCDADESPYREVTLSGFYMDKTEVTQSAYLDCVDAGACGLPTCSWDPIVTPDRPVACVDWTQATAYCTWVGKNLPTEAQWEKAARGADGRKYPWGNDAATCSHAVMADGVSGCGTGATMDVCSKSPTGDSPYGLCDMSGNVWEWTADWFDSVYYASSPLLDPAGPESGTGKGIRGGCFDAMSSGLRVSDRSSGPVSYAVANLGFRCARDAL